MRFNDLYRQVPRLLHEYRVWGGLDRTALQVQLRGDYQPRWSRGEEIGCGSAATGREFTKPAKNISASPGWAINGSRLGLDVAGDTFPDSDWTRRSLCFRNS